ncbi:MAG: carboxylesterase family protein [Proteobacteria bacterium]|nr:carboxylesterase family protein [Pseudomonadota bacterium]
MKIRIARAVLAAAVTLLAATVTVTGVQAQGAPRVAIASGPVVGTQRGDVATFRGIPFAAPPVRDLRWRPPQPVAAWSGDLVADRFSPMCLQPLRAKNSMFYLGEEPSSEDCLYLNVWSAAKPGDRRPVMVFVYGGGWTIGSASLPLYDGEALARKGAVVVSFNYRVGALGFLAHPELTAEGNGASGNYGLMDMIAALQWVKANIASFGGDPANVTLYGQSAGSAAVAFLQAAPAARGLFHRAIGQSGGYNLGGPLPTLADGEKKGVDAAARLKATSLAQLRALGGDAIVNGDNAQRPIVDGRVLVEQPALTFANSKQAAMPTLVGSNADEGTAYPVAMSAAAFRADAEKRYGADADKMLALYPAADDAQARAASYALMRDRTFAAPVRRWASEQAVVAPVFLYHFGRVQPFVDGLGYAQQAPASKLGAYHGAEMAYAYGTLDALNGLGRTRAWTDEDRRFSDAMMGYWVNFARTGNPNGEGLPAWPAYRVDREQAMLFGKTIEPGPLPNKAQLDFFFDRN